MTAFALIYAEGALDLVAAQKVLGRIGAKTESATLIDTRGRVEFWRRAPKYDLMARYHGNVFGLTDLDRDECAPVLIGAKLSAGPYAANLLRIAVRALESWLMADREAIADFLRVSTVRVPREPDSLDDPKVTLVNIARHSTSRTIASDMTPRQGMSGKVGPGYEARVRRFIEDTWDPLRGEGRSPSLRRAIAAIRRLEK